MTSILRRRADWAALIEATQQEVGDDETWARGIVESAKGLFTTTGEPMLSVLEHSPSCDSARYLTWALPAPHRDAYLPPDGALSTLGVAGFRAMFYPPTPASTYIETEHALGAEEGARAAEFRRGRNFGDAVGAFAYPEPGIVVALFAMQDREIDLRPYDRLLLARVALHLETSYRLRRRPEALKAVLDADGRVLERDADAPPGHLLQAHAARINGARSERDGDALSLWPALLSGRFSLVQRRRGMQRRYHVVENAPATQPFRALSPSEVEVVSQAARGHSTKMIAYALGLSSSVVSGHLTSATAKLGASSRMDLIRLAAMLTRDPRARFPQIALTEAERDVLQLLQQGLSNEQIAKIRSRSVRTIANQVAALLRKTSSASRRELLVRDQELGGAM